MNLEFDILKKSNLAIIGGLLQISVLIASFSAPFILNWKKTLNKLPKLFSQLFWLYGAYIVLAILGQSIFSICFANEIDKNNIVAKYLCLYIAIFWFIRFIYQFIFDTSLIKSNRFIKICYKFFTFWLLLIVSIYVYLFYF